MQDIKDSAALVDKLAAAVQSRADWQETAQTLRQQADSLDAADRYDAHMEMGTLLASRSVLHKEGCTFAMAQLCLSGIKQHPFWVAVICMYLSTMCSKQKACDTKRAMDSLVCYQLCSLCKSCWRVTEHPAQVAFWNTVLGA